MNYPVSDRADTFALMTAEGAIKLPRTVLEQTEGFDQLPPELFAAEPGMSGTLASGELQTAPLTARQRPHGRIIRDRAVTGILELVDPASGVAGARSIGSKIMAGVADLYINEWSAASRALIDERCISTIKAGPRDKAAGIIVHPGHIEKAVQTGRLSLPDEAQVEKLVEIDHASRQLSLRGAARALSL